MTYSRTASFIICFFVYAIAFTVAYAFIFFYSGALSALWQAFIADVIATLVVYAFSLIFKNASLYDPYWSVAPPIIAWYWWSQHCYTAGIFLIAIAPWALRLTLNWARGWKGLSHEDWRYVMLRNNNPKLYWFTNLAGIHLFPTAMVFLGILPVYYALCFNTREGDCTGEPAETWILLSGLLTCLLATLIEFVADEQMRSFKAKAKPGEFINRGLWKYSRHPNYFGEILFWLGLWIMQMSIVNSPWWTSIGFIAMLCMFLFASIPMMEEKNLKSKPGYADYIENVSILVPWFRKK